MGNPLPSGCDVSRARPRARGQGEPATRRLCSGIVRVAPAWLCAALVLAGCGGGGEPGREQRLNQGFARIQRHEAVIAREEPRTASAVTCDQACPASDALCAESEALCGLARELADADALARCQDASRSCRTARLRTDERCGCADD